VPNLRINPDGLRCVLDRAGVAHNELARLLGVDRGNLSRILRGKTRPGNGFIAGVWSLFGISALSELFIMDEED
jgi:hypothetical protein